MNADVVVRLVGVLVLFLQFFLNRRATANRHTSSSRGSRGCTGNSGNRAWRRRQV